MSGREAGVMFGLTPGRIGLGEAVLKPRTVVRVGKARSGMW